MNLLLPGDAFDDQFLAMWVSMEHDLKLIVDAGYVAEFSMESTGELLIFFLRIYTKQAFQIQS